jgi:hypothetical protein
MRDTLRQRGLVLALVLLPFLIFGAFALWRTLATTAVFPGLPAAGDIARIEIAREREQVVLARQANGRWVLLSADEAPGDDARIAAAIRQLRELRGTAVAADTPPPRREGVEIRLTDAAGKTVGHARFWTDEAMPMPGGQRLAIAKAPALPLWPSAWSALQPPGIAAVDVVSARRITPAGATDLSEADVRALAAMLAGLSATGFVPARTVNWAGADYVQVTLRGGGVVEAQAVPADDGGHHVRLTSDTLPDVKAARAFAFRLERGLP